MSRVALQNAKTSYTRITEEAALAEKTGDPERAVELARSAWQYVNDAMQFDVKQAKATLESMPCIDLVLRLAPLLLHTAALDELAELLKSNKRIDRIATDDLAQRLQSARERLRQVYRLLDHIERRQIARQDQLREALGGVQAEWRSLAEQLESHNIVTRTEIDSAWWLRRTSNLDALATGKCAQCGTLHEAPRRVLWFESSCRQCRASSSLVVIQEVHQGVVT